MYYFNFEKNEILNLVDEWMDLMLAKDYLEGRRKVKERSHLKFTLRSFDEHLDIIEDMDDIGTQ